MGWLQRFVSMNGKLGVRESNDRRLVLFTSLAFFPILAVALSAGRWWPMRVLELLCVVCLSFGVPILCLCGLRITRPTMILFVGVLALCILLVDLELRAISSQPVWPCFVLLADLALVLRLGTHFATALIAFTTVWVIITCSESMLRLGLYDVPGSAPDWYRWQRIRDTVTCTDPPCPVAFVKGSFEMMISLLVLVVDFAATRGFAESAANEQAAMARTIETVEAIAGLLAGYDVDTVAAMLEEAEGRLPPAMHEALRRLEENLRSYQPYLPAVLLKQLNATCDGDAAPVVPAGAAPGAKSESAAIVFTDIRASTTIWEAAPEAMKRGIRTHNAVMRSVLAEWGGYEVKTIGDAFMVAFDNTRAGVSFGLAVHEALLAAEWPAALLEVGICRPTALWGGLTVRVGCERGPCDAGDERGDGACGLLRAHGQRGVAP